MVVVGMKQLEISVIVDRVEGIVLAGAEIEIPRTAEGSAVSVPEAQVGVFIAVPDFVVVVGVESQHDFLLVFGVGDVVAVAVRLKFEFFVGVLVKILIRLKEGRIDWDDIGILRRVETDLKIEIRLYVVIVEAVGTGGLFQLDGAGNIFDGGAGAVPVLDFDGEKIGVPLYSGFRSIGTVLVTLFGDGKAVDVGFPLVPVGLDFDMAHRLALVHEGISVPAPCGIKVGLFGFTGVLFGLFDRLHLRVAPGNGVLPVFIGRGAGLFRGGGVVHNPLLAADFAADLPL